MSTRIYALTILLLLTPAGPLLSQNCFPERIVFNSDMDGDFDIWMIHPDGTELEVLIDRPGDQTFPRISPDGSKVAFFDRPDPSARRSIVVRDLATGLDTVLDDGFAGIPSAFEWRADGSGVIARSEGLNCTGDPLAFVPLTGGNVPLFAESGRRLTVMAVDEARDVLHYTSDPCWSPNTEVKKYDFATGQRSLVQASDGRLEGRGGIHGDDFVFSKATTGFSNARIHLMGVDGSGERVLSSGTGIIDANPRFSPDGRQVVFFRRESNQDTDLYLVDVDTAVETPLVLDPFNSASPDWGHLLVEVDPLEGIAAIIELIESFDLGNGTRRSLIASLENALRKLTDDRPANDRAACNNLNAFLDKVAEKLMDGELSPEQAEELLNRTDAVMAALHC